MAFTGWGDAAGAASSGALLTLRARRLFRVGALDSERFQVFTKARPLVRLRGGQRHVQWPDPVLLAGRAAGAERDVVVLVAAEPALRWREFAREVAEQWTRLGGGLVVLLGAFLGDSLHVGPVPMIGAGSTPELGMLLRACGVGRNRYEGPVSALTPIYEACTDRGLECVNLWAAVPHYLAGVPNPKVAAALVRTIHRLTGIGDDAADLERAAASFEATLNQRLALRRAGKTPDLAVDVGGDLPTVEDAIRQVERLLGLHPEEPPDAGRSG